MLHHDLPWRRNYMHPNRTCGKGCLGSLRFFRREGTAEVTQDVVRSLGPEAEMQLDVRLQFVPRVTAMVVGDRTLAAAPQPLGTHPRAVAAPAGSADQMGVVAKVRLNKIGEGWRGIRACASQQHLHPHAFPT